MLQFITNARDKDSIIKEVEATLAGGCKWVQLRMKESTVEEIKDVAQSIQPLCKENDAILVIDDYVEIAKELNLDGVHLGKLDMPPAEAREMLGEQFIIGITANCFEDIAKFANLDIDYVGAGPYRFTTTKKNLSPTLGLDGYIDIVGKCKENNIEFPIVAIGGIECDDIEAIMATGINGVAVSGGIAKAQNPTEVTTTMLEQLQRIINDRNNKTSKP